MSPRRRILTGLTGVALMLVAACNGGDDAPTLNLQLIAATREVVAAKTAAKTQRPPVTRAVLDTLEGSFMEVSVENTDRLGYFYVSAVLRDNTPGDIVVWRSEDNITLSLRNDVLIATRGLGNDLMSTEVAIRDGMPGPATGGARRAYYRARDNKQVPVTLACSRTDMGSETIVIVERNHPTQHIREQCQGGGGPVVNDYWIDSRTGLIWQSRQWAGPENGYLRLRRLTNG